MAHTVSLSPLADFSALRTGGNAPLAVGFIDQSTNNPTAWQWYFGDGSPVDTTENPTHTYAAAGIYTVSLMAANADGCDTKTMINYITVLP